MRQAISMHTPNVNELCSYWQLKVTSGLEIGFGLRKRPCVNHKWWSTHGLHSGMAQNLQFQTFFSILSTYCTKRIRNELNKCIKHKGKRRLKQLYYFWLNYYLIRQFVSLNLWTVAIALHVRWSKIGKKKREMKIKLMLDPQSNGKYNKWNEKEK